MLRLILIGIFIAISAYIGSANGDSEYIEIDAVINITSKGATSVATSEEARAAVSQASEILKKAGIKINVKKINTTGAVVTSGNADGDSALTSQEWEDVLNAGGKELDSAVGAGKGVKITFVDRPIATEPDVIGVSTHHDRTVVTSNMGTPEDTGQVIAHEMGHALTLSTSMVVSTSPVVTTSDDDGHVLTDPDNLMHDTASPTATQITTSQAEEMRKEAKKWGKTISKTSSNAPGIRKSHAGGGVQDSIRDATGGPAHADIANMSAYRCCTDPLMELAFITRQQFDTSVAFATKYYWLFDVDANPGTGAVVAGTPGIERGVEITVFSSGGGSLSSQVQFRNYVGAGSHSMAPASITVEKRTDAHPSDMPRSRVSVNATFSEFNFLAQVLPMSLVAQDISGGGQFVDRADAPFTLDYEQTQPALSIAPTESGVGQPVLFQGSGFAPLHAMTLYLDEQAIQTNLMTQNDGSINGTFLVPSRPSIEPKDFYFVTMVEQNGRSAFSVLHLTPCLRGDANVDGFVDSLDVPAMVTALLSPPFDSEVQCTADVNADGRIDGFDIQPFIDLLPP